MVWLWLRICCVSSSLRLFVRNWLVFFRWSWNRLRLCCEVGCGWGVDGIFVDWVLE